MPEMALKIKDVHLPRGADPDRTARMMARWLERARSASLETAGPALALADDPPLRALLEAIFGSSPFLGGILVEELPFAVRLFCEGPEAAFDRAIAELHRTDGGHEEAALMRELRLARRRVALTVALADLAGPWDLARVTAALSDFAQLALCLSTSYLLAAAHQRGELVLPNPQNPELDSGFILIAMGKLGARELNYSSDIDLIALFDRERVRYTGRRSLEDCFVRMTHGLVRLLQDRTAEGFVFRVDLRLRPTRARPRLPCRSARRKLIMRAWARIGSGRR